MKVDEHNLRKKIYVDRIINYWSNNTKELGKVFRKFSNGSQFNLQVQKSCINSHNNDGSSAYKVHVYNYSLFNNILLPIIMEMILNWKYKYSVDKSNTGVS